MLIWDALAVIGVGSILIFCGWCVIVAHHTLQEYEEVESKPLPEINDVPKWDKLNPVGKMANKELKKMYKGKMNGELI
jgi:hypothetical protein